MKTWRTWTRKEDALVEDMRLAGATIRTIARMLDRTEASVKNRVVELAAVRINPRPQQWIEILQAAIPLKEAARLMGVTVWAVKKKKWELRKIGGMEIADLPHANQHGVY